jgi:hypothetical protein
VLTRGEALHRARRLVIGRTGVLEKEDRGISRGTGEVPSAVAARQVTQGVVRETARGAVLDVTQEEGTEVILEVTREEAQGTGQEATQGVVRMVSRVALGGRQCLATLCSHCCTR